MKILVIGEGYEYMATIERIIDFDLDLFWNSISSSVLSRLAVCVGMQIQRLLEMMMRSDLYWTNTLLSLILH